MCNLWAVLLKKADLFLSITFSWRICQYFGPSIIPVLMRCPVPADEKQPRSMMLPPPYCTVVFCGEIDLCVHISKNIFQKCFLWYVTTGSLLSFFSIVLSDILFCAFFHKGQWKSEHLIWLTSAPLLCMLLLSSESPWKCFLSEISFLFV